MAGKFVKICTAFPLATSWTKILRGYPLNYFPAKKFNKPSCTKIWPRKFWHKMEYWHANITENGVAKRQGICLQKWADKNKRNFNFSTHQLNTEKIRVLKSQQSSLYRRVTRVQHYTNFFNQRFQNVLKPVCWNIAVELILIC